MDTLINMARAAHDFEYYKSIFPDSTEADWETWAHQVHAAQKQRVCNLLCATLHATDGAQDVMSILYDEATEYVTVTFQSGGKRRINVAMDSDTSMIRDIMNGLGC